jgi:PPOX class probable F420-dependent enzyme
MSRTITDISDAEKSFLTERHLGTLTTMRSDGTPHVVAIAFACDVDAGVVRIITSDNTQKVRNVERTGRAAVGQVDGPRWLTLEGEAHVTRDQAGVAAAVSAFEARYRPARENPSRVAIEIVVDRVMGRV